MKRERGGGRERDNLLFLLRLHENQLSHERINKTNKVHVVTVSSTVAWPELLRPPFYGWSFNSVQCFKVFQLTVNLTGTAAYYICNS